MSVRSLELSPIVKETVRKAMGFSAAERLFLAKELLDSLIVDEALASAPDDETQELSLSSLEAIVAQIRATPRNPQQIEHATKTVDEVLANWEENPADEPRLTTDEWEQSWWGVRQAMKQRDRKQDVITDWTA
jgi:hypothetical protein